MEGEVMIERFSIGLDEAQLLGNHVIAQAKELFPGRPVAVAIVDIDDALVWAQRMDGCKPASMEFARRKAITARRYNKLTLEDFADWDAKDVLTAQHADSQFMHWGGGAPIEYFNGHDPAYVIGGIGVSGLEEAEDHQLATMRLIGLGLDIPAASRSSVS